jgi:hypothetical protein
MENSNSFLEHIFSDESLLNKGQVGCYIIKKIIEHCKGPWDTKTLDSEDQKENNKENHKENQNENQSNSSSDDEENKKFQLLYEPDESPNIPVSKSMNYAVSRNFAISEEKFKASFDDWEFMKHYTKLKKTRRPPLNEWVEGLCKILPYLKNDIQICIEKSKDDDEAAVRIWTSNTSITEAINLALMMDAYKTFDLKEIDVKYIESKLKELKLDYKEVIENSIKFIRRVNTVLIDVWTVKNTEDRTVYRGVNAKLFPNVKVGDEFRIVNFSWTSELEDTAEWFSKTPGSGEANTILTMEIPKFCFNAGKIACYSEYEDWEKETLIPPYTSCKLLSKDGDNMHLVVAQDNLNASFKKYSY